MTKTFLYLEYVQMLLGLLVLWVGGRLEEWTIPVFQAARKIMGPLFLITGLYFLGVIKFKGFFTEKLLKYKEVVNKFSGNKRAFLLGVLLSLAFCPTMALLFFGLLMPLMLSTTGYGLTLPLFSR
ncbi:sulfite exporter TauE/SafE family protein [Caldalkalibacillus thermarum TA2.A1]|uniref:Sulfite exporter TauE/SafE family protein n=1 Tax=Caldalkalibacillus thermarum (strain TA2.A1) TaxID=986075 RepID=A0A8X8L8S3_CALTT|nr:sulfite exporter TauE/SafE family protein [Caldalkalibacillus thermarum]QZT35047.1 sulfite exporter TauE/SafE family protein [Caldalkalibacillus thermarum TA2.A1]